MNNNKTENSDIVFAPPKTEVRTGTWKLLIVDDDKDIHSITKMVLSDFTFEGKGIEFVSAYSGAEALEMMKKHSDIAIILLDVVMETNDAGLRLAKQIREDLGNKFVRIILRTGQPGEAPAEKVIRDYDINDYKEKTELTATKLFTTIISSCRSFNHLRIIDDQRNELEDKVKERTAELETVNRELEDAIIEIEVKNIKLLDVNNSLEEAQREANRDMKMAVNVQSKFFIKNPPKVRGWDINYVYKPCAGVSGDLYDIYEDCGNLTGVSIFDVSGHGIASALITMIAKTIIFRSFSRMDLPLNQVMENINQELIGEINDIDNYLTGILIRFNENIAEYVNAAHTDLFCKDIHNTVRVIEPEKGNLKGTFLGKKLLQSDYDTMTFDVSEVSSLLVYSDCLSETTNKNNEQYGVKRISEIFQKAPPDGSSHDVLKYIMEDFHQFVGDEPLMDDLTVLCLKNSGISS
ncbi:MAG: SpoIIE family protein phosphatase [bacterium]|nr:SpoIIE family protein phosphatase [bacterium]